MRRKPTACAVLLVLFQGLVAHGLAAQGNGVGDQAKDVVRKARSDLQPGARETQLAAVEALARIPAADAAELGVVDVLRIALGSKHEAVVNAAIDALVACGDRDAASAALADQLARLRKRLVQAPEPVWPEVLLPKFEPPGRLPPPPGPNATSKEKKEYEALLKLVQQHDEDMKKERERDKEKARQALVTARQHDATMRLLAREMGALAQRTAACRDDRVVDEVVRCFDACVDRCASEAEPLVSVLCASARRDAVATCAKILIEFNEKGGAVSKCLGQSMARSMAEGFHDGGRAAAAEPEPKSVLVFVGTARLQLAAIGQRVGVPVPASAEPMDRKKGEELVVALDEIAQRWKEWLQTVSPKLPARLAETGR